jgi:hypothetical protein
LDKHGATPQEALSPVGRPCGFLRIETDVRGVIDDHRDIVMLAH